MEIVHFGGDKYGVRYGGAFVSHNTMRVYYTPRDVKFYCVMSKEEAEIKHSSNSPSHTSFSITIPRQ